MPLPNRRGFRVMVTLLSLTVFSWALALALSNSYPVLAGFVWKEGFFFAGLAIVYRMVLASEESEAVARKYK